MRFVLTDRDMLPTDGAIIPELIEKGSEAATEAVADRITDSLLIIVQNVGTWIADKGLFILSEGFMVFGMFCFLMAIGGRGKWVERGTKSMIAFALVGVAAHAV